MMTIALPNLRNFPVCEDINKLQLKLYSPLKVGSRKQSSMVASGAMPDLTPSTRMRIYDPSLARRNSGQQAAAGVQQHYRNSVWFEREIRTRQGQRPDQARPRALFCRVLPRELRVHSSDPRRR